MNTTFRPALTINTIFWIAVTLFGAYFLLFMQKNKWINFGIDLVGGTYLTLDVKVKEAARNEILGAMQSAVDTLKEQGKPQPVTAPAANAQALNGTMVFENDKAAEEALNILKENTDISFKREGNSIIASLTSAQYRKLKDEAVEGNISILHNRLDASGAGEITIFPSGENNIVIELPNVSDPEKYKNRIGKAALLELKPVYEYGRTKDDILDNHGGELPAGTMMVPLMNKTGGIEAYILVPDYAKVTGRQLKEASYEFIPPQLGSKESPHSVSIKFKGDGIKKFEELTRDNIGQEVAFIIDNVAISAPRVNSAITGGEARISSQGDTSPDNAKELATMLKSGAFSAPVELTEERHIGPSLGQESIQKGLLSCAIGLVLLFLFSVFVYKTAGLFAFIVLIYNLLFILFGLALVPDATLTLPGIAGMVLTICMAIDSSILIYERIKEELAAGESLEKSVDAGFAGATSVILDANITTFIVGAALYYFGSPAIQGFALTLMIGIASTLITGLLMLRWIFRLLIQGFNIQKISF